MIITKIENKLIIKSPFSLKEKVKECPNRKWNPISKRWEAPLSSLEWLRKDFPEAKFEGLAEELKETAESWLKHQEVANFNSFAPHPQLYNYQKEAIKQTIQSNTGYGLFADMGTGKTFMALEIIRYLKKHNISPALVICPLILIKNAWFNDCIKFEKDLKIISLRDVNSNIPLGYDIYCLNYEQVIKKLRQLKSFGFKILIVDESSRIKSPKTQITKTMIDLSKNIDYKYCLSGTPAPNKEQEYWGQLRTIEGTYLDFYKWRNIFFYPTEVRPKMDKYWECKKLQEEKGIKLPYKIKNEGDADLYKQFYKYFIFYDNSYILRPSKKDAFIMQLKDKALFLKKEDCLDLPEKVFIPYTIDLNQEEKNTYVLIKEDIIKLLNDEYLTLKNALSVVSKLRQVVSGFCYKDAQSIWEAKMPSKIEVLKELLKEINSQVIIWIQFEEEKQHILKHFKDIYKINCLTGRESDRSKNQNIEDFLANKSQILVAHPRSAGHGLTFINCCYSIFYSRSFSLEEWRQSQDRIHRQGQNKKCFYYILQTDTWVDKKIENILIGKEELILQNIKNIQ